MELAYKSYACGSSYYCCYDYCLFYLIWADKNEFFRLTPSTSSAEYRYFVSAAPALKIVLIFLDFYFFVFISSTVSASLCVFGSVCNPFQIFKNLLLWGFQWLLSQKMITTQWLTLGEWDFPVDNDLNWSSGSQVADKKITIKKVSMYMWSSV